MQAHAKFEDFKAALPPGVPEKIDSVLSALAGSLPSDAERAILYRIAHALKMPPTDTTFSILAALHVYLRMYEQIPGQIGEITEKALGQHKEALNRDAQQIMSDAANKTVNDMAGQVGKMANQVATSVAGAEKARAVAYATKVGAIGAIVVAVLFGILGYGFRVIIEAEKLNIAREARQVAEARSVEAEAKADQAQKNAMEEAEKVIKAANAAAGWAATPQGRLAHRFFVELGGEHTVKCSADTWEIRGNKTEKWCIPKRRDIFGGKVEEYGWRIP